MLWVCVRVQKTMKSIKKLLIFSLLFNPCFLQSSIKHTFVCIAYVQAKKIIVNSLQQINKNVIVLFI